MVGLAASRFLKASSERRYDAAPRRPYSSRYGYNTKSADVDAGNRSFWHGAIRDLCIKGPGDGTHTGWAMKLGSGSRYTVENIEISGTGNGIQVLAETGGFDIGDAFISIGLVIDAVIDFVVVAFVLFFIVKAYNHWKKDDEEAGPTEIELLTEIRDSLRQR